MVGQPIKPLKKTDSPFPWSYQLSAAPLLVLGILRVLFLLPEWWLTWSCGSLRQPLPCLGDGVSPGSSVTSASYRFIPFSLSLWGRMSERSHLWLPRCGFLGWNWAGQIYVETHTSPVGLWYPLHCSLFLLSFPQLCSPRPHPFSPVSPLPSNLPFLLWCQKSQLSVNNRFRFKLGRSCCARWSN